MINSSTLIQRVINPVLITETTKELFRVKKFQAGVFEKKGYHVSVIDDPDDRYSVNLFIEREGEVQASLRIFAGAFAQMPLMTACSNDVVGLDQSDKKYAELGRFVSISSQRRDVSALYGAAYMIGQMVGITDYLAVLISRNLSFYQKLFNVEVLNARVAYDYGTGEEYSLVKWTLSETPDSFFRFSRNATHPQR